MNHNFDKDYEPDVNAGRSAVLDKTLMKMLKDMRREMGREKKIPPYVIFQDPSLEEMATNYPITMEEMANISGVSIGKAKRYGKNFVAMIKSYVEENDIERPTDFVVKQVANKSKAKVNIIQSIDRKIPLEDIATSNQMNMEQMMEELDACLLYTSPSPRDKRQSRMPSSA